jgi:prepilin-type N-terminal cleavage/methylation domain-containing protein
MRIQRSTPRTGFTLMELLVATALILFIMAIIAQAFGAASKTFTTMRTAGQLQERNRTATNIIRKDLWADHFGPPFGYYGGTHVMHQRLDLAGWRPPAGGGYFEMVQGSPSRYEPGDPTLVPDGIIKPFTIPPNPPVLPPSPPVYTDGEQLYSTRAKDHMMRFTTRLPQGPASELYCARFHPFFTTDAKANAFITTPGMYYSRWAEVCYFLVPTGPQLPQPPDSLEMTGGNNPRPLHSLRRRVRLLPPREIDYQEISPGVPMTLAFAQQVLVECQNNFPDVIQPIVLPNPVNPAFATLRLPGPETLNRNLNLRIQAAAHPNGDDILLTDVISFELRPTWINNPLFHGLTVNPASGHSASPPPEGIGDYNSDEPFADLRPSVTNLTPKYAAGGFFDTWGDPGTVDWDNPGGNAGFLVPGPDKPPTRINVRGLQIKIRIWDKKAEQARQVTVINEL